VAEENMEKKIEVTQKPYSKEKIGVSIIFIGLTAAIFLAVGYWAGTQSLMNGYPVPQDSVISPEPPEPPIKSTDATDATADWKTYTNEEYGFSFKYPETWKTSVGTNLRVAVDPVDYKETSLGLEWVGVQVIDLTEEGKTFEEYVDEGITAGRYTDIKTDTLNGIKCKSGISTPIAERTLYLIENGNYLLEVSSLKEGPVPEDAIADGKTAGFILGSFELIK